MVRDITDYTEYGAVRTVLGLDIEDLTDAELGSDFFALSLQNDLLAILPTTAVGGINATVFAKFETLVIQTTKTTAEQILFDTIQFLCPFLVARAVLPSILMRAKKSETDGKAAYSRFTLDSTFSDNLEARIQSIITAINGGGSIAGVLPVFTVGPPANDIVLASTR